jgi:hypothetical protein
MTGTMTESIPGAAGTATPTRGRTATRARRRGTDPTRSRGSVSSRDRGSVLSRDRGSGPSRGRSPAIARAYARRAARAGVHHGSAEAGDTGRTSFVMLVMALLGTALIATLWLSTAATADSYHLQSALKVARNLTERSESLSRQVATLETAPELARRARELGMVPAGDVARLVVRPDGGVVLIGQPRRATAPTPPPVLAVPVLPPAPAVRPAPPGVPAVGPLPPPVLSPPVLPPAPPPAQPVVIPPAPNPPGHP